MEELVLICGAGLSGLLLAQGLRKTNIPFRLYERDRSLHVRSQGSRIRISDAGVQALRDNMRPADFGHFLNVCCAQDVKQTNAPSAVLDAITTKPGRPLFASGQTTPLSAFETVLSVDRSSAREVLSHGLGEHLIFGKEFAKFEERRSGILVTFSDDSTAEGALLVAADGVWSKIPRQNVPDHELADSQARLIFGKTVLGDDESDNVDHELLSGLKLIQSDFRNLFNPVSSKAAPYQIVTMRPSALPTAYQRLSAWPILLFSERPDCRKTDLEILRTGRMGS